MNGEAFATLMITVLSLIAAYLSYKSTGPLLSVKYLLLPRTEKAAADKPRYYRQATLQFLFIAAIFACAALVSLTGQRLFMLAMPVVCMVYVVMAEHHR